jgi:catechol 2,3-dioxygenase-like lactoylglutathione lyase family enzyme
MPVREFFHLIHVVDDLDEADAWYDAVFSPQRYMAHGWSPIEKRWASLSLISDFVLETIEPSDAEADQNAPLPRFRKRFGQHLHSLAWYVDEQEVAPLFSRMRQRGIRMAKPGGGLFPEGDDVDPGVTIFTHPKDTHGQLEFQGLGELWNTRDPRFQSGWSTSYWRDEHPLGIERASHVTTLVTDLEPARSFYEEMLDGRVVQEETGDDVSSVFLLTSPDLVVELAKPSWRDSRLRRDLAANGELPHALTFKVRDLDAAERHVDKVGVRVVERNGDTFTLDPSDCFNAVLAFTSRTFPDDPRA